MFAAVQGNVLGTVMATAQDRGFCQGRALFVWKVFIKPLLDEVAEGEEFPKEDARAVVEQLVKYCLAEGLAEESLRGDLMYEPD